MKNDAIACSIIIPFHNAPGSDRSDMMQKLLHSIPDVPKLEIILVDDRSTLPFQPEKCFEQACLKIIPTAEGRQFAGPARNTGIEAARGTYILFSDSDDLFDTEGLQSCLEKIDTFKEDVIFASAASFLDGGMELGTRHMNTEKILKTYRDTGSIDVLFKYHAPWGRFIRRHFLMVHDISFGETRSSEDVIFSVKLILERPTTSVLGARLYLIREGNDSLTSNVNDRYIIDRFAVIRDIYDICRAYNCLDMNPPITYQLRDLFRANPKLTMSEMTKALLKGKTYFPSYLGRAQKAYHRLRSKKKTSWAFQG